MQRLLTTWNSQPFLSPAVHCLARETNGRLTPMRTKKIFVNVSWPAKACRFPFRLATLNTSHTPPTTPPAFAFGDQGGYRHLHAGVGDVPGPWRRVGCPRGCLRHHRPLAKCHSRLVSRGQPGSPQRQRLQLPEGDAKVSLRVGCRLRPAELWCVGLFWESCCIDLGL